MNEQKSEWGPLPRGIYMAMLWFTVFLGWVAAGWLVYYVPMLIFPGLEKTSRRGSASDELFTSQGARMFARITSASTSRRADDRL